MNVYKKYCREQFDERGVLTGFEISFPDNYNFGYDAVDELARLAPEQRALVWCNVDGEERTFTFDDISRLSNRAANVLAAGGIKKGDRVMVMLKRRYEYWYTAVALHKLGAVLIPVTHMLTADDIVYRFECADVRGVVCVGDESVLTKVRRAKEKSSVRPELWTIGPGADGFRSFTEEVEKASDGLERVPTLASEPMIMYFTSGTTGYPKGVMHDHSYTLAHILTAKHWQNVDDGGLHLTVAETGWGKASWGKIYGQWLCGCAVMVYDFENFDPRNMTSVINRYGVTSFCAPPTIYRYLVKKGTPPMPGLKYATTAGEALNPEVFKEFLEQTGLTLMEGFGQTESTLILGNLVGTASRPGSMGRPTPLYHVELLRDDGEYAGPGETGEIVIIPPSDGRRQAGIFSGYNENEGLYRYVWRGGVYHTGDTAWRDEDGYFWFNGRIDDVIKTGGFRVGPFEIENVLMEHPAVMECSVVGIPDPLRGQVIKAIVVPAPGHEPTSRLQKEIREFCNKRVAEYKWVRMVEFVREMPKTISGKIRKVEQRGEQ